MNRLFLLAAALTLPAAAPANDIVDFFRDIVGQREAAERRQREYEQRYNQRYRPQEAPPPISVPYRYPTERVLTPEEAGLRPGYYDTTLPTGEAIRLRVRPNADGPPVRYRNRELIAESVALRSHAEALLRTANSVDDNRLQSAGEKLTRAARRLNSELEDADIDDARRESRRFTESFDDFGREIGRYRVGPNTAERLRRTEAVSERIAFALRDVPGGGGGTQTPPIYGYGYDRPRLVALTGYLVERTGQLASAFQSTSDFRARALARDTQRIDFSARGLREAVLGGADFDTLVSEYRRFDEDWHRLLNSVDRLDAFSPQLLDVGRRIWAIDWGLSELLLIDAAYYSNEQATRHVMERLGSSTRRLERELQLLVTTSGRRSLGQDQIVELAGDLSRAVDDLQRHAARGRTPQSLYAELADHCPEVEAIWARLAPVSERVDFRRPEVDLRSLVTNINTDINRLRMAGAGRFDWRAP